MTATLRLVRFQPGTPSWNMAVDEALLVSGGAPLLRFYGWRPFGLSLGWFQDEPAPEERADLAAAGIEVVRRLTGGGAILHAHEVTYSLSGPDGQGPFAGDVESSYRLVHGIVIEVLREFGLALDWARAAPRALKHQDQPFLCFARSTALDLVAGGRKLVGSAKRRRGGRALQHGSIVLRGHERGGGGPGIEDLLGRELPIDRFQDAMAERLAASLGLRLETIPLPEEIRLRAGGAD
ncbi:MAG: lipoate--protein ligase [Planctomycetes bacterium]|nr:lipoate--protein ligase [Planctomycetota bacterium]